MCHVFASLQVSLGLLNWNGALASGTLGMGAAGGPSVVAIVVLCLGWPRVTELWDGDRLVEVVGGSATVSTG